MKSKILSLNTLITLCYSFSSVAMALFFSWLVLLPFDFSYGFWHDHGDIGQAIDKYGPQNRYIEGFHLTSKAERVELFAQINQAVHSHGEGLEDISFQVGQLPEQKLLREPEVIHLQDVANLIDHCRIVVVVMFLLWLATAVFYYRKRRMPPVLMRQMQALMAGVAVLLVVLFAIGPARVFSWMHEVVFHDGPWFFYYQDSLMSTLMWAPRLFGWIAIEWGLLSVCVFMLQQFLMQKLLNKYIASK